MAMFLLYGSALSAKPEIIVASEGFTNKGLHTEFSIYADSDNGTPKISIDRSKLPSGINFIDKGNGEARFIWENPEIGKYTLIILADDKDRREVKKFPFVVGDYGYPPENQGKMIMPKLPPPKGAVVIHVSTNGSTRGNGSLGSPVDIKTALNTARRLALPATKPIYILFKRGDYWKGKNAFTINKPLKGKKNAPIVFGAYGKGDDPIIDRLFSQTDIEYLHFQDLEFRRVSIHANKVRVTDEFIPGTNFRQHALVARYSVQRLRFFHCTSTRGGFAFKNKFNNAGRGSLVPYPNSWQGGGPRAGMMRDIEISHSLFRNTTDGGTPDAINFNGSDRGIWIHHNKFENSKEEHIDIAGGSGHIVEHNVAAGSTTHHGIKLHSQFSLLTNTIVRYNTVLYAGGWDTPILGSRGNAFIALNIMGSHIHHNNFISRFAAAYGDERLTGDRKYYGTFAGNRIDHNVYRGCVQIKGQHNNTIKQITKRNLFSKNMFASWPDSSTQIRYWDRGTPEAPLVGTKISGDDFNKWTDLPVDKEVVISDAELRSLFENPKLPTSPNSAIDITNPGDWSRIRRNHTNP